MPTLHWNGKHLSPPKPASLTLDSTLHPSGRGYPNARPSGRVILGDNLEVMSALLPEYEGRINLIYADPPFFTNREFHARVGRGEDSRKPANWKLAKGYQDSWTGMDAYLQFLYERLSLMHRLLAPNGTLYLHLDWHADSHARLILDEIFGAENFINEIIWTYHGPSPIRTAFNRKHDTILMYAKGKDYTFNVDDIREPYNPNTLATFKASPKAGFGKVPDLERGKVPEDWWYFPVVARLHNERTGYPTQKPESMLERIILASSNKNDLVADFFCGSGTTALVAAKNGRKFITCDESPRAVQTARARLSRTKSIFTFERDTTFKMEFATKSKKIGVKLVDDVIQLKTTLDVDFWEVDPAWDGKTFRSAAQAQRHVRSGEIPMQLKIKIGGKVCIRLITVEGKQFQLNI
ncbi:MAG: site-specific DNA-methyltransferase [Anaerolineales bacterium]|nr:site-specific DNA-methyltransferase [Anaerolineales bacterium]MCB9146696.1 site-specific DNA-methyltransferase [Anaerolineales bacterium]